MVRETVKDERKTFFKSLMRQKVLEKNPKDKWKRVLNLIDLILLGIGSSLGLGIYIIAGKVASTTAGPAVTLSFFVAGCVSLFAALCYAEFGSRVPLAGSAYIYSYITIGEVMAFVIGWNLILEYSIGTASVARGYSKYIDLLFDQYISKNLKSFIPSDVDLFSEIDVMAFGIIFLLTVLLSGGIEPFSKFNNILTVLNLIVVLYIIVFGSLTADIKNWKLPESEVPPGQKGGFFPFGIAGMLSGAATCFYGFVGFDCLATTSEEVENPQYKIPISICISVAVVFVCYCSVSAVETLMVPYYEQDHEAPLLFVFIKNEYRFAPVIITSGAFFGLSTSLLGSMIPLPRIIYAMANDGLIFSSLAKLHPQLKTPISATLASGCLSGLMAMSFDIKKLADMMSIGTLLAYTLVSLSILILRYEVYGSDEFTPIRSIESSKKDGSKNESLFYRVMNIRKQKKPNEFTSYSSKCIIFFIIILSIILNLIILMLGSNPGYYEMTSIIVLVVLTVMSILALAMHPKNIPTSTFIVPFVPYIPIFSIISNILLMVNLPTITWNRFFWWMLIGFCIYFGYGFNHSKENHNELSEVEKKSLLKKKIAEYNT